jgi:lipoprotein-anchoring transpeptidase ErfK/SrfK
MADAVAAGDGSGEEIAAGARDAEAEAETAPGAESDAASKSEPTADSAPEGESEAESAETESEPDDEPETETAEPDAAADADTEAEAEPDIDATADAAAETESEPDLDATTDAEPEVVADAEPEAALGAAADAEREIAAEADPETDSEPELGAAADAEPEIAAEADPETDSEPELGAPANAEPEGPADADPETDSEAGLDAAVDAAPEGAADAEPESDVAADTEPEAESEAALDAAADTELGVDAESPSEADTEPASDVEQDPEPGPDADATRLIASILEVGASTRVPDPDADASRLISLIPPFASASDLVEPAESEEPTELAAESIPPAEPVEQPAAALPPSVLASASFVPPQPPQPQSSAAESAAPPPAFTRPTVTLAGRQIDRRAALVAGGVGVAVVAGVVVALASSGGSSGSVSASGSGHGGAGGATAKASTAAGVPLPTITTNPADGASGVDPSKPITVKVLNGTIDSVQLSGEDQTSGTLSTDNSTWTSDNALSVNASYKLTVTAKNSAGKTKSTTVSFHTLKPSATFGVSSVVPPHGSTVGVGQPIRVTFDNYVPTGYKASLEKACVVKTDPPVAGAWYWVSNSTDGAVLDWRPKDFWAVDTKVSIEFNLNGVRLGQHQYGVKNYPSHDFAIRDTDLRLIVDKDKFTATCYRNGKVIRTFPIDTGQTIAETFVTYTGTMAVLGKGNPVEMKGNYGPGDTYDDFVNWATQITWSGTYVHAAPWDGEIGHANDDSHGCVHCRTSDAEWFYNIAQTGDVVTINGKRKRPVLVSNGICTFTLDWATLLKGSAYGATVNGKPTTA